MEIMLDLETLDNKESAIVLSIGAVAFDWDGRTGESFVARLDTKQQQDMGRTLSESTVLWWLKQSDTARSALNAPVVHLALGLADFTEYVNKIGPIGVWGCGADFDCRITQSLYNSLGVKCPFSYQQFRCYRTLKALRPDILRDDVASHVANEDALFQAHHAIKIGRAIGLTALQQGTTTDQNSVRSVS